MSLGWLDSVLDAGLDLVVGSGCVGCGRSGRLWCTDCDRLLPSEPMIAAPTPGPAGLATAWVAGEYASDLRALIVHHKEHAAVGLARPLGRLLALAVGPLMAGRGDALTVLVPVPSRPAVVRARGYDAIRRMVRAACHELGADLPEGSAVVRPLLRVRLPMQDQSGLDAAQRAANLHDSFAVVPRQRAALARLERPLMAIVCDDVLTTGATAREAQRALEDAGIVVAGIAAVAATVRRFPG